MIDEGIIEGLREYLKDHYVPAAQNLSLSIGAARTTGVSALMLLREESGIEAFDACYGRTVYRKDSFRDISDDASDYIKKHRKPGGFAHALDRIREEKSLSPAQLYKKANVDRRLYSRLMGPEGRHPSMNTVISFALALQLERGEFDELLQMAGYALSNSSSRDVCILYCLEKGVYDIDDVNALLFAIGIEPLTRDAAG